MNVETSTSLEFFSGREQELEHAVELYRRSLKTRAGGTYLVTGAPGIGKTWFCRKLFEELSRRDLFPLVLRYRFTGDDDLNSCCASLARQAAHQRPNDDLFETLSPFQRAVLQRQLPDLIAATDQLPPGEPGLRAAAPVWQRCFAEIASREDYGLLLWLDDTHQAQGAAWDWIAGLCRQALAERMPVTLLIALRQDTPALAAGKKADALLAALREEQTFLKAAGYRTAEIPLLPLTVRESGQLLEKIFGTGFAAAFPEYLQWLVTKAGGNPFFMQLLIQSSIKSGQVDRGPDGSWRHQPQRLAGDADSVDDLIARRVMEALAEPALERPLHLAVALGDAFRFEDWRQLLGLPRPAAIDVLLSLQRRGILNDFMLGFSHRVQFAHPLLLEAYRSILPVAQQRAAHRAAAALYNGSAQHVPALDQLIAAGAPAGELEAALRPALQQALGQDQWLKILQWCDSIQGLGSAAQTQLLLAALKAASSMGRVNEALALFDRLNAMRPEPDLAVTLEAAVAAASALKTIDLARAADLLEQALRACPLGDPRFSQHQKNLLLQRFYLFEENNEYRQAVEMGQRLLALDPADGGLAFKVNNTLGLLNLRQGNWDEADRLYREQLIPFARGSSELELCTALENRGAVLSRLCRFAEAEEHFDRALAIAERYLRVASIASVLNARGSIAMRQGQYHKALADKERAARIAFTAGNNQQLASCLNDIAGIKMELGEQAGVIELFQRSLRLKETVGNRAGSATTMTNIAMCYLNGAGTAVDYAAALEWAQRANQLLVELNYNANLVDNIVTMSQASLGLGQHGQALAFAEQAVAAAARIDTPYNRATALAQKGTVLRALGSADAEAPLREAADLFASIGNRAEQARALRSLAGHYQQTNATAKAGELALRAAEIYRGLKLEKPLAELIDQFPAVFRARTAPAPLPPAERGAGLRVQTLGQFRVTPSGGMQPLTDKQWGSQLGRLMLAYLLTVDYSARQGVERQRILETFWSGGSAGGSMRVLLHRLRKCLDCRDAVLFADNKYMFNWKLAGVWFDREQMESRYRRGADLIAGKQLAEAWDQLEEAESLFRGQYLEGIEQPWAGKARKALADTHRDILDKLIELSRQLGRGEAMKFYQEKRARR
ncbi:MAG TPA: tetratricopeptide repeat protein [Candidatus Edwardsbacteria bacterium]|nr:tetratricopeptide repeat protein [Candidatus Edwardsbacteria bacterium]